MHNTLTGQEAQL